LIANLKVIIGSTRPGRAGAAVAEWFHELAVQHGGFDTELVDLAAVGLPLLDEPEHPRHGRYVHEHTKRWSRIIAAGDAYAFVVPEYNHGYNAATKNALDYLADEWRNKPVGFVSYGGIAAGTRSVQMLIQVVTALGMIPAVTSVNIPLIQRMLTKPDRTFTPNRILEESGAAMLDELARWAADLEPVRRAATQRAATEAMASKPVALGRGAAGSRGLS
jgi:NAD(P)H-dependent FMN reductase